MATKKRILSDKSTCIFVVCLLALLSFEAAFAACNNTELVRVRYLLVDKQHRLEENRDRVAARIARLRQHLDCMQKQQDVLDSEITKIKRAVVETDQALASL